LQLCGDVPKSPPKLLYKAFKLCVPIHIFIYDYIVAEVIGNFAPLKQKKEEFFLFQKSKRMPHNNAILIVLMILA